MSESSMLTIKMYHGRALLLEPCRRYVGGKISWFDYVKGSKLDIVELNKMTGDLSYGYEKNLRLNMIVLVKILVIYVLVDCSDFMIDSDYFNKDDNLYDKNVDHNVKWLRVNKKQKQKQVEVVNKCISEKMCISIQDENDESNCEELDEPAVSLDSSFDEEKLPRYNTKLDFIDKNFDFKLGVVCLAVQMNSSLLQGFMQL